jgi:hypothetical protein
MLACRMIQIIESHADRLAEGLVHKLAGSQECSQLLADVPAHELKHRAYEIYHGLSEWLFTKTESEIEERYTGLGMRRAHQEVPFSQLLFAAHATKEYLWEYLRLEGLLEPEDLIGEMELLRAIERFFDQSLYFAAIGYEEAKSSRFVRSSTSHAWK